MFARGRKCNFEDPSHDVGYFSDPKAQIGAKMRAKTETAKRDSKNQPKAEFWPPAGLHFGSILRLNFQRQFWDGFWRLRAGGAGVGGGRGDGLQRVRVSFGEPHWSDPERVSHAKPHGKHEAAD